MMDEDYVRRQESGSNGDHGIKGSSALGAW